MKTGNLLAMLLIGCLTVSCMSYEKRVKECDFVGEFKDGNALCQQDDKYFFIDESGKQKSKKYDKAEEFVNGYAIAYNENENGNYQYFVLDKNCRENCLNVYGCLCSVNRLGNLWVKAANSRDSWMLVNVSMGIGYSGLTLMIGYPDCVTDNGTTVISRLHKEGVGSSYYEYAIYDGEGKEIVPFGKYSFIGNFSSGIAQYSTTGRFGYAGSEHLFSQGYDESKGKCRSLYRSLMGYINEKGEILCSERFNSASPFNEAGYARVSIGNYDHNSRHYILNRNMEDCSGNVVARASFLDDGVWISGKSRNGECLLTNNTGKTVSLGSGFDVASLGKYIMTRKDLQYKLYKMNESADKPELIGTFNRSKKGDIVVFSLTTSTIRFFQPIRRSVGMRESPYDEYDLDGGYVQSGWNVLYNGTVLGDPEIKLPYFNFE
ncbi:WG repeat-containing protein [Bacteroides difficilis]|mgnify:FL=1|uniref:WG repeat-containing protein n=1 Tax=Bacteroides difficilis TaxID=2763021 RepID=UPI003AB09106